MPIKITVDCRELKLIEEIRRLIATEALFKDIELLTENLLLGDITIQVHHHTLLIERKTVDDLLASIKDGRYDEQSYRLRSLENEHNIYYFIEGKVKKSQQLVYSSILSLNYFKGFSVIKTDDLKETANMILYFSLKLNREEKKNPFLKKKVEEQQPLPPNTEGIEEKKDLYPSLIQKKKNENITVNNFSEIVLCQIPLVNHTFASVIMKKYDHNLNSLTEALKANPDCLNELSYTTSTNKVRKISKTCLQNIVKFLCPSSQKQETKEKKEDVETIS